MSVFGEKRNIKQAIEEAHGMMIGADATFGKGDGKVTRDELVKYFRDWRNHCEASGDGATAQFAQEMEKLCEEVPKVGKIDIEKFKKVAESAGKIFDTNKDGIYDPREYNAAIKKAKEDTPQGREMKAKLDELSKQFKDACSWSLGNLFSSVAPVDVNSVNFADTKKSEGKC